MVVFSMPMRALGRHSQAGILLAVIGMITTTIAAIGPSRLLDIPLIGRLCVRLVLGASRRSPRPSIPETVTGPRDDLMDCEGDLAGQPLQAWRAFMLFVAELWSAFKQFWWNV